MKRQGSQAPHRAKVSRVVAVVSIVLLLSLVNTLVLHRSLGQHHNYHKRQNEKLYQPLGRFQVSNNDTRQWVPSQQLRRQEALNRRRVQDAEAVLAINDGLAISRLKMALEKQRQECVRSRGVLEEEHGANKTTAMAPFGLLGALNSWEERHNNAQWHCQSPSPPKEDPQSTNQTNSHRWVLIVTSSGRSVRTLFVQLLKWLHLQQIQPTKKRGEVPIRWERIWVLLPSSVSSQLQQDEAYGARLLKWDRLPSHPVQVRFASSFWDAVEQVEEPIDASLRSVWLDGDQSSDWNFDWWQWFQRQYQTMQQQRQRLQKHTGRTISTQSMVLQLNSMLHIPSSLAAKLPCRPPEAAVLVPDLHQLTVWDNNNDDINHLCWLSHPALQSLRQETTNSWVLSKVVAALWLTWQAEVHHGEVSDVDEYKDLSTKRWVHDNDNTDHDKLLSIVSYMGGLPPSLQQRQQAQIDKR